MDMAEKQQLLDSQYYKVEEYALVLRCEPEKVRRLCRQGKVPGAFRLKHSGNSPWLIPRNQTPGVMQPLPGAEDWGRLRGNVTYAELALISRYADLKRALETGEWPPELRQLWLRNLKAKVGHSQRLPGPVTPEQAERIARRWQDELEKAT